MKVRRNNPMLTTVALIFLCIVLPLKGGTQECPVIEDLTGDTSAIGNPDEPRPWEGEAETGFLEFDEINYYVYRNTMHGREVRVAFSKGLPGVDEYTRENFTRFFFNVWNYYWNIFQGFPFLNYTTVFVDGPVRDIGSRGAGYEIGYPEDWHCGPSCQAYLCHCHEIFHAWVSGGDGGINPADRQRALWFIEGFTVYYEKRSYYIFKENVRPWEDCDQEFSWNTEYYVKYYLENIKGTEDDIPLTEMGYLWDHGEKAPHFINKGFLVACLLDKRLTEDGSNLDELMRYMFHNFNHGLKRYTVEDIRDAANVLTGKDYTQFFDDYVFGTAPLPVDETTRFNLLPHGDILTKTSTGKDILIRVESGGSCARFSCIDPSTIPDDGIRPQSLIYGLFDMQIIAKNVGGMVKVVFYLSLPAGEEYTWFKYSPIEGWYSCAAFVQFNPTRDRVTLTLIDGGGGDHDGVANGVIVDPSGLGTAPSGCICDVNGDGEVTPQDALCAFHKYLEICPTVCGLCETTCCDVTQDGDCTPADALEIFKEYLGLPSVCSWTIPIGTGTNYRAIHMGGNWGTNPEATSTLPSDYFEYLRDLRI